MNEFAWVYILTNDPRHTVLYVGCTTDIAARLFEHRTKQKPYAFSARYNLQKVVYLEGFEKQSEAVKREKYIKGKTRKWKEALIRSMNPEWRDLTVEIMQRYRLGLLS